VDVLISAGQTETVSNRAVCSTGQPQGPANPDLRDGMMFGRSGFFVGGNSKGVGERSRRCQLLATGNRERSGFHVGCLAKMRTASRPADADQTVQVAFAGILRQVCRPCDSRRDM